MTTKKIERMIKMNEKRKMEPYQVRMVKEYDDVHRRLEKLIIALNSGIFTGEEKLIADDQRKAMVEYMMALRVRARLHGFNIINGQTIE